MAKVLLVRLDMNTLRSNLQREDGRPYTDEDVRRWLNDAGFRPDGPDQWRAEEATLAFVNPSEVLETKVVEDS